MPSVVLSGPSAAYWSGISAKSSGPPWSTTALRSSSAARSVDAGGTLFHHHGVGLEHRPWMAQDVSAEGVELMRSLFAATDPGGHLNPGKIVG